MLIGVVAKIGEEEWAKLIVDSLRNSGYSVITTAAIDNDSYLHQSDVLGADLNIIIPVGGDGLALKAITSVKSSTKIFGINRGHLGFLCTSNFSQFEKTFDEWIGAGMPVKAFKMLTYQSAIEKLSVFNEVALLSTETGKIAEFNLLVDDVLIRTIRGDGIVIATENGSTAYAMSAGGPLVDPSAGVMVVVPSNEFNLASRPIIVGRKSIIKIEAITPLSTFRDGIFIERIVPSQTVTISDSERTSLFPDCGQNYFDKIKELSE